MLIDRTECVELVVPATTTGFNTRIPFLNQPQLQTISGDRQIWLNQIETFTTDTLSGSPITSGNPVATAADVINAVLNLKSLGEDKYHLVPLARLCMIQTISFTPWNWKPYRLKNALNVDWQKSYIQILTPPAGVLPYSYIFSVDYSYTPDMQDVDSLEEVDRFKRLQSRMIR